MELFNCYKVKGSELIEESFTIEDDNIFINVGAQNYQKVFKKLAFLIPEPCFFILEVPCDELKEQELRKTNHDPFHKDIYYLDGVSHQIMESFIDDLGYILFEDGLSNFGFSSHNDQIEIMKLKYNLISIYAKNKKPFVDVLKSLGIKEVEQIVTVSDIINKHNPGYAQRYEGKGNQNINDVVKMLKEIGLYLDHVEAI